MSEKEIAQKIIELQALLATGIDSAQRKALRMLISSYRHHLLHIRIKSECGCYI